MGYIYQATKAFLKVFTEGLYQELKDKGVKVELLCPGFTKTDFYRLFTEEEKRGLFSKFKMFTISPKATVDYSLKCLSKNKSICLLGAINRIAVILFQLMPRSLFYKWAAKMNEM